MSYTIDEVKEAVKKSRSICECLRHMNKPIGGSMVKCLRNFIIRNNIDISHFKTQWRILNGKCPKKNAKEVLIYDNTLLNRVGHYILKRCLIEIGRKLECEACGIKEWNGSTDIFQVDHKNRNWKDNTPANLRFLCANCHVLTENYGNRKKKSIKIIAYKTKITWPTPEQMQKIVWEKPVIQIAKDLGVSDAAIHKFCKKYKINKPDKGYWIKFERNK